MLWSILKSVRIWHLSSYASSSKPLPRVGWFWQKKHENISAALLEESILATFAVLDYIFLASHHSTNININHEQVIQSRPQVTANASIFREPWQLFATHSPLLMLLGFFQVNGQWEQETVESPIFVQSESSCSQPCSLPPSSITLRTPKTHQITIYYSHSYLNKSSKRALLSVPPGGSTRNNPSPNTHMFFRKKTHTS